MVKNYQKNISELFLKVGDRDTEPDIFYETVEHDYRELEYSMINKHEDLKIILDLLRMHPANKNFGDDGRKLLNKPIDTATAFNNTQYCLLNQLQQGLVPHHINHGKWLFENGKIQEAFIPWETVLKLNPYNDNIHSKLIDIIDVNSRSTKKAEDLNKKYHFKYIGSFGNTILKSPCSILTPKSDKHLFVSDYDTNHIHKFTYDGNYLGVLPIELKYPMGLFQDDSNSLWICDFGNSRLLGVDFDGCVIDEINLKNILNCNDRAYHPTFGCVMHDQFYLTLRNADHEKRHLVTFNKNNPDDSLKILTDSTPNLLGSINIIQNKLYTVMINPACLHEYTLGNKKNGLYEYDFEKNQFKLLRGNYYSHLMRQFVQWNSNLFMTCGESLVKLSIDGTQHFSVNLSLFFGFASMPTGLAVIEQNNGSVLSITDTINNSIHQFLI